MSKGTTLPLNPFHSGKGFEHLMEQQANYVKALQQKGKMPDFPVDINSKAGQKVITDLVNRGIQELAEVFEISLMLLERKTNENVPGSDRVDYETAIKEYNTEISDSLCFFMEVLLYTGITRRNLWDYLRDCNTSGGATLFEPDLLHSLVETGKMLALRNGYYTNWFANYVLLSDEPGLYQTPESLLTAGRYVSMTLLGDQSQTLWMITYRFNIATNLLKKKPHRVNAPTTNPEQFGEALLEAYIELFRFYAMAGCTGESLYTNTSLVINRNIQRLNDNY